MTARRIIDPAEYATRILMDLSIDFGDLPFLMCLARRLS
jgi:hypothetical protein